MTALAAFHDLLMPELPGCSVAMVNLHLRETAREFCMKTSAWRQTLTAIDLVAAQASYALVTPTDSEVVRITQVTANSELLWRDSDADVIGDTQSADPKYLRDEPPFTLIDTLATITLVTDEVPTASVTAGLTVIAALKPTATAATLPDFLFTQYSDAMRYGTLSRLMVMGKKPWGDRPLAIAYDGRYQSALNFAAYQAAVGNSRKPLRVKKWS